MSTTYKRALWAWGGLLALLLCLVWLPLTLLGQIIAIVVVLLVVVIGWRRAGRVNAHVMEATADLPPEHFRHPVVAVCGDGVDALFGLANVRETPQGCYLRLPPELRLVDFVDSMLAQRAGWSEQISILRVINPQQQSDAAVLAGQMREFCYQVSRVSKLCGRDTPVLFTSYLAIANTHQPDELWFEWLAGQAESSIGIGRSAPRALADWLAANRSDEDETQRAERFQCAVTVKSWREWMAEFVLPHCQRQEHSAPACRPVAIALSPVAALPASAGNHSLWQQWLASKTTLGDGANGEMTDAETNSILAFPDRLLRLLPQQSGFTPLRRTQAWGIGLFTLAAVAALGSSAWHNRQLLRQVSDDIQRYNAIRMTDYVAKKHAVDVLIQDEVLLDNNYRQGVPLRMGLGLYPGERLRQPLLATIATYLPPPPEKVQEKAKVVIPKAVRLDSLSLFDTNSAKLKAGSTKVLVSALVDIKAQPGWLIVIAGHTDSTGNPQRNVTLSQARAEAVRDWMRSMGDIPMTCFAVQGYGASQPIASNETDVGRAANRRVDIRLVPEAGACKLPAKASDF